MNGASKVVSFRGETMTQNNEDDCEINVLARSWASKNIAHLAQLEDYLEKTAEVAENNRGTSADSANDVRPGPAYIRRVEELSEQFITRNLSVGDRKFASGDENAAWTENDEGIDI